MKLWATAIIDISTATEIRGVTLTEIALLNWQIFQATVPFKGYRQIPHCTYKLGCANMDVIHT